MGKESNPTVFESFYEGVNKHFVRDLVGVGVDFTACGLAINKLSSQPELATVVALAGLALMAAIYNDAAGTGRENFRNKTKNEL